MTLALTNGNIPAMVLTLMCLQTMKFFQRTGFGFGESRTFFGGAGIRLYMMGLGQGNRAAPPSLIQLSVVLVYVFKQLELGALVVDPNTQESIHSMGTLFVDDTDLDTWKDGLLMLRVQGITDHSSSTFQPDHSWENSDSRFVGPSAGD